MDNNNLFKSAAGESNLRRSTQPEVKLDEAPDSATMPDWVPSVSSLSAVVAVAIVLLMTSKLWAAVWLMLVKQVPQKIPCRRCRFFSGNPHLRCAVHPTTVLSQAAIDCQDYSPQTNKFF